MKHNYDTKAKDFAYKAHEGQTRKDGVTPFTNHLDEVASIVRELTDDKELIAVAYLHDTVEDTDVTLDELRNEFNERIAHLVDLETEDKRHHLSEEESWRVRKEEQINHLKTIKNEDKDVFAVVLGDKLAILREIKEDFIKVGDKTFNKLNNKNKEEQYWYYNSFYEVISESSLFTNHILLDEMKETLDFIFK